MTDQAIAVPRLRERKRHSSIRLELLRNPLSRWALQKFGSSRFDISGGAPVLPLRFRLKRDLVTHDRKAVALEERMAQIDAVRPIKRIYVMGCGRSGTWLLTAIMSTLKNVCVVSKEVPVEYFSWLTTTGTALILKRNSHAYRQMAAIPAGIGIVYIIRHPFDVLTSTNKQTDRRYHVQPERWIGEMAALRSLIGSQRRNLEIVRYEDLVSDAKASQHQIAQSFALEVAADVEDLPAIFKASTAATVAMHGLRRIDSMSVGKYKNDPEKIEYLKSIVPTLADTLDWVASEFSYDVGLR